MTKRLVLISVAMLLNACASGPSITTVQELSDSADAPYENVLVVSLFESFDIRRYLETEIVRELRELGVQAIASTSKMDSRTPVTRQTFAAMVDELGSDAYQWAEERKSQTLLVQPDPTVGLVDEHFTRLELFGRSCSSDL